MATSDTYIQGILTEQFSFAAGSVESSLVVTSGATLSSLCFSNAFTPATISFVVSPDGVNYYSLTDGSTGALFTVLAAHGTAVPTSLFFTNGFRYYKLISSATQTFANNVAAQLIPLVNKEWN